ncbi:MAG TPA: radical SAM protein [Thermodesulfobacteriota bacterium]|nr:radical SAM protein [Thermodesulfobacteriota bacterium]
MRILFIYPNLNAQIGFNYGISFLSAVLKDHGHYTGLLNINEQLGYPLDLDRIQSDIKSFAPDLIGISMVSNQYHYCEQIAAFIKEKFPSLPIVGGGIHATADPEGVMASGHFDFLCLGEGEHALLELVSRLETGGDCSTVSNIWARKNGALIRNRVSAFVDIASLPQKDYDIFDFQKLIDAKGGWVGVMASRGCPYRCTYCFNHQMINLYRNDAGPDRKALRYIRRHPIDDVITELAYLINTYRNITTFIFDDDIFTLSGAYLQEFCRRYQEEIRLPFVVNGHVKNFDRHKAFALKEAGCTIVKFGLESGSERVRRDILHRYMSNEDIEKSFAAAHEAGLHTSAFVMFGFPYETKDDILMTIRLLGRIKPGRFRWSIFFPYANTDAWEIARKGGFIDEDKWRSLDNFFEESCLRFGDEMDLWIDKLQKVFPWYVNRYTEWPIAGQYADLVKEVESLTLQEWENRKDTVVEADQKISGHMIAAKEVHYAIKYNSFMGVRSDYFLAEEQNGR